MDLGIVEWFVIDLGGGPNRLHSLLVFQPRQSRQRSEPAPMVLRNMNTPNKLLSMEIQPTVTAGIVRSQQSTSKSFQIFDLDRPSIADGFGAGLPFFPPLDGVTAIGCPCQSVTRCDVIEKHNAYAQNLKDSC